jgi:hypothetical protein
VRPFGEQPGWAKVLIVVGLVYVGSTVLALLSALMIWLVT